MAAATIRPDDWNLPLLVHLVGAMVLVGALCLALTAAVATVRGGSVEASRLGMRALLWAALPAWIVMRVGAQWISDEQGYTDDPPGWITIGFGISEASLLLIVGATILAWRGSKAAAGGGGTRERAAAALIGLVVVSYVVAIWAMTAKPG